MQQPNEEEYKSLREELIGHYRKELAYIYTNHDRPPVEYYTPVKAIIPGLILHLGERKLNAVLAECWKIAWYREPTCHPNECYPTMVKDEECYSNTENDIHGRG
ncbi:MAG: hypothetical protein ACYDER_05100 [Ktedonobacteraceae bacterium]